ncbi:oxygenase MpaB family protein [soil metagenome]
MISVMQAPRPDPLLGFYGPDSMMWRINREAVLLGVGPTALLLQIAHPLVARGVAEHSTFETDPFRRLHGTIRTTMDLVFGNGRAAERAVRRLNRVHAGVRGDGYRALDPELLLWVQATLIVSSARAYERWVGPLAVDEWERFWQEARAVGVRLGIPLSLSPADWPALDAYWERMLAPDGPIRVTPTARRLAPLIIRPPLPYIPGALVDLAALPGLALLPARLRDEYGISWTARRERLAGILGTGLRGWVRVMPRGVRQMPHAARADHRVQAAASSRQVQSKPPQPWSP